jgi:hypothetical protein
MENVFTYCITAVIITIVLTLGSCSAYKTHKITEAVNRGADAMRLNCAINAATNDPTCVILALPTTK